MNCKKCGNEILDGEKYCGKCGNNVKENKIAKFKNIIIIASIFIVLIGGTIAGLSIYGKNIIIGNIEISNLLANVGINGNYIEKLLLKRNPDNENYIIKDTAKVLAVTDISYNDCDKLVIYSVKVNDGKVEGDVVSIGLINKKENRFSNDGCEQNLMLLYVFKGIYNSGNTSKFNELAPTFARYIESEGIGVLMNTKSNLFKEVGQIVGVNTCRSYIETSLKASTETTKDFYFLYEKNDIICRYTAQYVSSLVYNKKWEEYGVSERLYKYYEGNYDRDFINTMTNLVVGEPAYKLKQGYKVYDMETGKETTTNLFNSLEEIKSKYNVE